MVDRKTLQADKEFKFQVALFREMKKTALALREFCLSADFSEEINMDRLKLLLEARQVLIGKIDSLSIGAGGMKKTNFTCSEGDPIPQGPNEARTAIAALQIGIATLDKESRDVLTQKMESLKVQLRKVQTCKKFSKAYRPAAETRGIFLDSHIATF